MVLYDEIRVIKASYLKLSIYVNVVVVPVNSNNRVSLPTTEALTARNRAATG